MSTFRIAPFEGRADITCIDAEDLNHSLRRLHKIVLAVPTLVNVYDDAGRIAIIGLGSERSTVQLVDKLNGETHRTTLPDEVGENIEFSYQGEATFVRPRFLIPLDLAIRAVGTWFSEGKLLPNVTWLTAPCPPIIASEPQEPS